MAVSQVKAKEDTKVLRRREYFKCFFLFLFVVLLCISLFICITYHSIKCRPYCKILSSLEFFPVGKNGGCWFVHFPCVCHTYTETLAQECLGITLVQKFPRAPIAKYCKVGIKSNRNGLSHDFGGQMFGLKTWTGPHSPKGC